MVRVIISICIKAFKVQLRKQGFFTKQPCQCQNLQPFCFLLPNFWAEHLGITNPEIHSSKLSSKRKDCTRIAVHEVSAMKSVLMSNGEATSGAGLYLDPQHKGDVQTLQSPTKAHKDEVAGAPLLIGDAERWDCSASRLRGITSMSINT